MQLAVLQLMQDPIALRHHLTVGLPFNFRYYYPPAIRIRQYLNFQKIVNMTLRFSLN